MNLSARPWSLIALSAGFVVTAVAFSFWLLSVEHKNRMNAQRIAHLRVYAHQLKEIVNDYWPDLAIARSSGLVSAMRQEEIVAAVVMRNQSVRLDANKPIESLHWTAPEVQTAFRQGFGSSQRFWLQRDENYLMVAVRLRSDGPEPDAVWLAQPAWQMTGDGAGLGRRLAIVGLFAAILAAGLAYTLINVRRRMLYRLVKGARQLSRGDLQSDIEVLGEGDLAVLSMALNTLRRRMSAQVETIDRQRQTLAALVNQLHEGVVVARGDGRIVLMNPAAVRMLNLKLDDASVSRLIDKPIENYIPQHQLQRLLLDPPSERDLTDPDPELAERLSRPIAIEHDERTVFLHASVSSITLGDTREDQPQSGVALVMTDVTELQRTIQLRTDFVANASHELRTPLSTIRAAVETLLSMDLRSEAEAALNFLEVIDRHSARLEDMVKDLLDLSRLETPTKQFDPEPLSMRMILSDTRARFNEAIERKGLELETIAEPSEKAVVHVNPHLLRLALDNLIDNAIKFTEPDKMVHVRISLSDGQAEFEVRDEGCGIPKEDLERVFERFYQVESARTGIYRGTGLGLSIVRHAVGAMRGRVELNSEAGVGTTVRVVIPQTNPSRSNGGEDKGGVGEPISPEMRQ
jgi:two-component system phosphate regulon sensor histidine kinase PhoR